MSIFSHEILCSQTIRIGKLLYVKRAHDLAPKYIPRIWWCTKNTHARKKKHTAWKDAADNLCETILRQLLMMPRVPPVLDRRTLRKGAKLVRDPDHAYKKIDMRRGSNFRKQMLGLSKKKTIKLWDSIKRLTYRHITCTRLETRIKESIAQANDQC